MRIAAENTAQAKSGFLPRIDFQGGYTAQAAPQAVSIQGREVETQDAAYVFFGVTATQLDAGGSDLTEQLADRVRVWAELFASRGVTNDVIADTALSTSSS